MLISLTMRPGTHAHIKQCHGAEEETDQLRFSVGSLGQNEPHSVLSNHFKLNQRGAGSYEGAVPMNFTNRPSF